MGVDEWCPGWGRGGYYVDSIILRIVDDLGLARGSSGRGRSYFARIIVRLVTLRGDSDGVFQKVDSVIAHHAPFDLHLLKNDEIRFFWKRLKIR